MLSKTTMLLVGSRAAETPSGNCYLCHPWRIEPHVREDMRRGLFSLVLQPVHGYSYALYLSDSQSVPS
jgi:hypothetical protein